MKQFRPQGARTRSVSARDSFPRTDLRNLETAYQNCSLLVSFVLPTVRESRWRCFEPENVAITAKAFFNLRLALFAARLVVALFVSAVFRVLGQHLSSRVIDLVIDGSQLGVVSYKHACQLLCFRIGGCRLYLSRCRRDLVAQVGTARRHVISNALKVLGALLNSAILAIQFFCPWQPNSSRRCECRSQVCIKAIACVLERLKAVSRLLELTDGLANTGLFQAAD